MLAFFWATFAAAAQADEIGASLGWYGGFAVGDLASTKYAEMHGAHEANPLMKHEAARYALKAGQVAGLVWLDRKLAKRDRRLMWACRLLYAGVNGYAIVRNVRNGR
jgi:hypothetical protein